MSCFQSNGGAEGKLPFGTGVSRICAVVGARTAAQAARDLRLALRETSTAELRLDWLASDQERKAFLGWLRKHPQPGAVLLATCRRKPAGGKYPGDIPGELFWLMQAREAGCAWCDIELETLRELPETSVRGLAVPRGVLLSMHDFERTPALPRMLGHPARGQVDAVKIAACARTIADSVRLLKLARHSKDVVAVPMGEAGLPARILALREGSALAYAPVAEATAPGQVSLHELKHLYRAHRLTRHTRVFGVIGEPIGHSLSPLLHNTGFVARRMDAVYLPFLVHRLKDFLLCAADFGLRGFSVTLPHKQTILKHLDECEPLAAQIGAVNTVTVGKSGRLVGSNTDYLGVLRALEKNLPLCGARVLIFGAGGSARAAAFALAHAGALVSVCARRESAAKQLARAVGGETLPRTALRGEKFSAIVNATPIGMQPRASISPLEPRELNCDVVMDLIYRPQKTRLLHLAAKKGIATVSGVEMFLAQGFAQWETWTATSAPEAPMRRAVLAALSAEEHARRARS